MNFSSLIFRVQHILGTQFSLNEELMSSFFIVGTRRVPKRRQVTSQMTLQGPESPTARLQDWDSLECDVVETCREVLLLGVGVEGSGVNGRGGSGAV